MPVLEDKLKDIKTAIDAKRNEAATAWAAFEEKRKALANAEDIDITNPNDPKVVEADEAMKPYSKAADELRVLEGQFERIAMMQGGGVEKVKSLNDETELDRHPLEARETFGQTVVESEHYKQLAQSGAFHRPGLNARIGEPMDRGTFAALLTQQAGPSGGVLTRPQRMPGVVDLPQLPLGVFDLLTVGTTDSNAIEYVRLLARTIRAAEVGEAATAADIDGSVVTAAQGGLKPESDLTFDVLTEAVKTIAHWIPATRNTLADAAFLQTLIDSELQQGVSRRAETQSLQGDGSGNNIRGLYNQTGIASYTQGTAAGASGEPRADAIHRSYTQIRLAGFEPSGTAIHPLDWQEIRLFKDSDGNYIFGPPSLAGQKQLWGVSAAETIAATSGQPISGEWARAMFLIREAIQVFVSDSHKDWFTRNMVAILAEMRGVLIVPRPQAFGKTVFA